MRSRHAASRGVPQRVSADPKLQNSHLRLGATALAFNNAPREKCVQTPRKVARSDPSTTVPAARGSVVRPSRPSCQKHEEARVFLLDQQSSGEYWLGYFPEMDRSVGRPYGEVIGSVEANDWNQILKAIGGTTCQGLNILST